MNVPYSAEYKDTKSNISLLEDLAGVTPTGGEAGLLLEGGLAAEQLPALLETDTFRHNLPLKPQVVVTCGHCCW